MKTTKTTGIGVLLSALLVLAACTAPAPVESTAPPETPDAAPEAAELPDPAEGPGAYLDFMSQQAEGFEFWANLDPGSGPAIQYTDDAAALIALLDGYTWEQVPEEEDIPWDEGTRPPGGVYWIRLLDDQAGDALSMSWCNPWMSFYQPGSGRYVFWRCTGDYGQLYRDIVGAWQELDAAQAVDNIMGRLFQPTGAVELTVDGERYTLKDEARVRELFQRMEWSPGEPREETGGCMTLRALEEQPYGSVILFPDGPEVHLYLDEYLQLWYRAEGEESLYDLLCVQVK